VQLLPAHVQPVPDIDASVKLPGRVSVTVTVPLVGPAAAALETTSVYAAPAWPGAKFPVCDLLMLKTGAAPIIVESLALADAEFPPDTLAEFTCGEAALAATFTVAVIDG